MQSRDIPVERVCLLNPKVPLTPTPSDGDAGKFTWFFFGVRPRPFFPALSSFAVSPSNIVFLFLSVADFGWFGWSG